MPKFIVYGGNNPTVIKNAILQRGNWEDVTEERNDNIENVNFVWRPVNFPVRLYAQIDETMNDPNFIQIINHFENNRGICTKTGLIRSLKQYYYQHEHASIVRYTAFESIPTSFILIAGYENQEYLNFIERFKDIAKGKFSKEHIPEKHCQENIWLIKPANMNQGRGIEIFKNLFEIENFLQTRPKNTYWVAQKYIEKPLLYYGRKFDIRMWVLVTAKNEIFYYRKAYMRTSSSEYVMNNFNNFVHLTNNCLQKYGDNFGKFEDGNTLPLETLQLYIDQQFPNLGIDVKKHIIPRMKDLIIDTILSVKKQLNPKKRKYCFELFGYDFLIDEDFRTWLLEVNTNPYLGVPNDFIKDLLPKMVDDMFQIVVDPFIPPSASYQKRNEENNFELIYCENGSLFSPKPKNDRGPINERIYPNLSIAPPLKHLRLHVQLPVAEKSDQEGLSLCQTQSDPHPETLEKKGEKDMKQNQLQKMRPKSTISADNEEENPPENIVTASTVTHREKEKKISWTPASNNTIEGTAKQIEFLLDTYGYLDYDQYMPLVNRILSCLVNWELHGDKEISTACNAIKSLAESRVCAVLTDPVPVGQMIKLIDSQNVPLEIQMTVISGILQICRKFTDKKRLVCDSLVQALIKISIASCDEKLIKDHDKGVIKLAIQCLCALSGQHDKKKYIPGESRDIDKLRNFLIHQGSILALYIISKRSVDSEIRAIPEEQCFPYLDLSEWILQKNILESLKDKSELQNLGENSSSYKKKLTFLFKGNQIVSPKVEPKSKGNNNTDSSFSVIQEMKPNIPHYLLDREDYKLQDLYADIEELVNRLEEEKKKREQEEKERREQQMIEKKKEQEERERQLQEKRKKAEEMFFKRIEEKKKQQEEIARKLEEENRARLQELEERRLKKIQEIQKKREEFDKKIKQNEMKSKRQEEEMKKFIEEEEAKKKAMRKAMDESFWNRVKAKAKEKEKEKEKFLEPIKMIHPPDEEKHERRATSNPKSGSFQGRRELKEKLSNKFTDEAFSKTLNNNFSDTEQKPNKGDNNMIPTFATPVRKSTRAKILQDIKPKNENHTPRQRRASHSTDERRRDAKSSSVNLPSLFTDKKKNSYKDLHKMTAHNLTTLNEEITEEEDPRVNNSAVYSQDPSAFFSNNNYNAATNRAENNKSIISIAHNKSKSTHIAQKRKISAKNINQEGGNTPTEIIEEKEPRKKSIVKLRQMYPEDVAEMVYNSPYRNKYKSKTYNPIKLR